MKRRDFFKGGSLAFLGSSLLSPFDSIAAVTTPDFKGKQATNIIFLVSDGMSTGTLNMANMLLHRKTGKSSKWISLYEQNRVTRALMDTASASSMVTDSAAASSSWGGGVRVPNGSINVNADGSENMPILQKFKKAGKSVGVVTTVTATHATPAGFSVTSNKRSDEPGIAVKYLDLKLDVIMGGGLNHFSPSLRKDGKDLFGIARHNGYEVVNNRKQLLGQSGSKPLLGIFSEDALPYSLDRANDKALIEKVPTLAEMTKQAIHTLSKNKKGFVLQVEAGKVDWAAHANDVGGLLYDQVAFDEAVAEAIAFAEQNDNTLVVITTDHGNANPGLFYGSNADRNFERIFNFKHTNNWILDGVSKDTSVRDFIDKLEAAQGFPITTAEAEQILVHYGKIDEKGLYNPRNLPYKELALVQSKYTSVGWGSMDHSADYVELAMFGPGSELLKPFVRNTDLHNLMLRACGVIS
ncbi:alkaline phosphatase [Pedobacter nyackensis]|uniref:alkaline phosphatase n=1 Tax=Pedobacter nyackensis TaxID=475255 RepID=UPI00292E1C7B|nr:alkaline phosphatase [Pedobacter nyackensis]